MVPFSQKVFKGSRTNSCWQFLTYQEVAQKAGHKKQVEQLVKF